MNRINGWIEWLDRMVGQTGWIEWLDRMVVRMVGQDGWIGWLDRMVGQNGWIGWLDRMVGQNGWIGWLDEWLDRMVGQDGCKDDWMDERFAKQFFLDMNSQSRIRQVFLVVLQESISNIVYSTWARCPQLFKSLD